jgi:hypothetical protein
VRSPLGIKKGRSALTITVQQLRAVADSAMFVAVAPAIAIVAVAPILAVAVRRFNSWAFCAAISRY